MMQLYGFFRSGTSHRTRIAMNLKGLTYEYVAVDLRIDAHHQADFKALNPQGLVPVLVAEQLVLSQSPAIIEWLEERYPTPALLPADAPGRARVRAMAAVSGCDIHPVNNKRVLDYLRKHFGADEQAIQQWCATWIDAGFEALEVMLAADTQRTRYCYGQTPTIADVYLVAQVEGARRFKVDLAPYPNIVAVDQACMELDAFHRAAPLLQSDAPR